MYEAKRLLVPLDYSDVSRAAVSAGLRVAAAMDAEVWLLTVEEGMDREMKERIITAPDETVVEDRITEGERALVDAARLEADRCTAAGKPLPFVPVHTRVTGGQWFEVILNTVAELQIDMIVVGTHGRDKGMKGIFSSTISEKLVAKAPCSVLVVKPEGFPYLRD